MNEEDMEREFLNKVVEVKVENLCVIGKLLAYSHSQKGSHQPGVLKLETPRGIILVRGNWRSIGIGKEKV